jgi:hypothetical protein
MTSIFRVSFSLSLKFKVAQEIIRKIRVFRIHVTLRFEFLVEGLEHFNILQINYFDFKLKRNKFSKLNLEFS